MRIAITASTGLIGSALSERLRAADIEVVNLVRRQGANSPQIHWDPTAADGGLGTKLNGMDAVIHLSGAPIAARRWSAARKQELRASRIGSTSAIVRAMLACPSPPPVLLAASAIGFYGQTGDRAVDETAPSGSGFLATLVRDWETAAQPANAAGIRVVHLRSGIVLSSRGGMLQKLLPPFRLGLGARLSTGTQYLSWITLSDHVRAVRMLLDQPELNGPFNVTGPSPVTNATLTKALGKVLRRPAGMVLPATALRLALGEVSVELLGSNRVLPSRLQEAGFAFRHAEIESGLAAALNDKRGLED
ncbi:MAG TPA: TIGR01777 family oxidoreductase [Streptosporangiaceae bacterium]|nr:TIGR01777 family oxidoreductase [Streptosporangiaceae bacterium]